MASVKNVVLVHGGFVDGGGWEGVYRILKKGGYQVTVVQNPTISLQDDAAVTRRALSAQDGPTILVGHSYGGAVITEAGTHPKVAALVYITAFAPDKGESVGSLIKDPPPGAPVPPILPPQDGFLALDKAKFSRVVRGRRRSGQSCVHGRFAGSVGPRGHQRDDQRPGVADQTELVPGRHRGPDDSSGRPTHHGQAGRIDGCRGQG